MPNLKDLKRGVVADPGQLLQSPDGSHSYQGTQSLVKERLAGIGGWRVIRLLPPIRYFHVSSPVIGSSGNDWLDATLREFLETIRLGIPTGHRFLRSWFYDCLFQRLRQAVSNPKSLIPGQSCILWPARRYQDMQGLAIITVRPNLDNLMNRSPGTIQQDTNRLSYQETGRV